MTQFFAADYSGSPFILFGSAHWLTLSLILILCLLIVLLRRRFSPSAQRLFRWSMCALILLSEASWHLWKCFIREWNVNAMLPLWLCSLTAWTMPLLLIFRWKPYYQFAYPMGFIGAWMALLQPDLMNYGPFHFRFVEYFLLHGLLVIAIVYMTAVEGFRPQIRYFPKLLLYFNLYWLFCALINPLVGGNYLYTAGKLPTPSILDVLGPHPWYLLWMEGIGILLCLLAYLPFILAERLRRSRLTA